MKKSVTGAFVLAFAFLLVLSLSFACAETYSSTTKKAFVVSESAVSGEVEFGEISDLDGLLTYTEWIVVVAGLIILIVIVALIIRNLKRRGSRRVLVKRRPARKIVRKVRKRRKK